MNIFFLDEDPVIAAQSQYDIHVNKMMIESAQMLSCAHWVLGSSIDRNFIYKPSHINHPANKWVQKYIGNYEWLLQHALALCSEFSFRRKNRTHKTQLVVKYLANYSLQELENFYPKNNEEKISFSSITVTRPPLCMPDAYKTEDTVGSYRSFYKHTKTVDKRGTPMNVFTKRRPPEWLLS